MKTLLVRVWALVSRGCRESVELYLDRDTAHAAFREVLDDEPAFALLLDVVELDWLPADELWSFSAN